MRPKASTLKGGLYLLEKLQNRDNRNLVIIAILKLSVAGTYLLRIMACSLRRQNQESDLQPL